MAMRFKGGPGAIQAQRLDVQCPDVTARHVALSASRMMM